MLIVFNVYFRVQVSSWEYKSTSQPLASQLVDLYQTQFQSNTISMEALIIVEQHQRGGEKTVGGGKANGLNGIPSNPIPIPPIKRPIDCETATIEPAYPVSPPL